MTARDVSTRLLVAVGLFAAGCYDVPKPDCGFRCGSNAECPDGYTCASDGRCHRDGSEPNLTCPTPDAGAGYSPRVVASMPMPGEVVDRTVSPLVFFDVDVAGVSESSFFVVLRSTQEPFDAFVTYDPFAKRAGLLVMGVLPANEQFDLILTSDIVDPQTSKKLMAAPISFATGPDTTPPEVSTVSPSDGALEISVAADVAVTFGEGVTNASNATLRVSDTATLPATVSYNATLRRATIALQDQLAPHTTYTVTASSGILDASSNPLVPFTSTFTTGDDFVIPQIRVTSPTPGGINVPVGANVVVTFDEPVMNVTTTSFQLNNGAIPGTVTMSNSDRTITFDPTANLPTASTITVTLTSGITDLSDNPLPNATFTFQTP